MSSYEVRVKGRKPVGPLPTDLIVRGLELRRVPFDAQIREEGTSQWVPLASIDEFYDAMGLGDAQTRLNQRPVFDATNENDGDEATRVLSSLWGDHPPLAPPGPRPGGRAPRPPAPLPPAPTPPSVPHGPSAPGNVRRPPAGPLPPARRATKGARPAPGPRRLAEAGTYEAPTAVVDGFDVTSRSRASRPGRASGPPRPPRARSGCRQHRRR